jgi:hypothetical protein
MSNVVILIPLRRRGIEDLFYAYKVPFRGFRG